MKRRLIERIKKASISALTGIMILANIINPITPVMAATEETPFKAIKADNLFMVDGWGDLVTSIIRKGDGTGSDPIGYCLAKQKTFPHEDNVLYENVLDSSMFTWDKGDGTNVSKDAVDKVMRAIYAFNFEFGDKLNNYGLSDDDTMSLFHATQIAIWSFIEGWSTDMVKKQPETISDPTLNDKADKIYNLYLDIYNYANGDNTTFEKGTVLLNVTDDVAVQNNHTYDLTNTTIYKAADGKTYYRSPLLSLIANQDKGIVWDDEFAYTYTVSLDGAPGGARIVNENGTPQNEFSTKQGVGTDFYIEVPTTNLDHEDAGQFSVNITTTKFYRMQPILWNPTMDTEYQSIMQLGAVPDSGSAKINIKYPESYMPEPEPDKIKAEILVTKNGNILTSNNGDPVFKTEKLEGAGFEIYLNEPNGRYEMTDGSIKYGGQKLLASVQYTGESGTLLYSDLPVIKDKDTTNYLIKEVSAPKGYIIGKDNEKNVAVTKGDSDIAYGNVEFTNDAIPVNVSSFTKKVEQIADGSIELVPAEGVEFTIYTDEEITLPSGDIIDKDTAMGKLISGSDGAVSGNGLSLLSGYRYYIKETYSPYEGTILDQTKYYIDLKNININNETVEINTNITINNGSIVTEITNKLQDTNIKIQKYNENVIIENGEIGYSQELVNDPSGYEFIICEDNKCEKILETISSDNYDSESKSFISKNEYKIGQVVYIKESKESDKNHEINPNIYEYVVSDTIFSISNKHSTGQITINKSRNENNEINPFSGVEFELYLLDGDNEVKIMTKVTDKNGKVVFSDLPTGYKYKIKEIVPDGYTEDENIKDKEIVNLINEENIEINIINKKEEIPKGSILINKNDIETSVKLSDVEFSLYKYDNDKKLNYDLYDNPIKIVTTNQNGEALFNDLELGSYVIKETKVKDGYIDQKFIQKVDLTNELIDVKIDVSNKKIDEKGNILINKFDLDSSEKLPDVKFGLYFYDEEKGLDYEKYTKPLMEARTNKNGEISFNDVPFGEYVIKEIEPASGYKDEKYIQKISLDQINKLINLSISNTKLDYKIEVYKKDQENKDLLGGAVFALMDANNNVLETQTTNEKGKVEFIVNDKGIYYIKEIKAPEGYVLNSKSIKVDVNQNTVYTYTVYNEKPVASLKITKIDGDTKEKLDGSKFKLEKKESTPDDIPYIITINNGEAIVEGLKEGKYILTEIEAPNGYELLSDPIELSIEVDTTSVLVNEITVENFKKTNGLKIKKIDEETAEFLPGAKFEFINAKTNEKIATKVTDKNGEIILDDIPINTEIIIKEIVAPDGYILNSSPIKVNIEEGEGKVVTISNRKNLNDLVIEKAGNDTDKLLGGAKFKINGPSLKDHIAVTDSSGRITLKNLIPGEYTIEEIESPTYYKILEDKIVVKVDSPNNKEHSNKKVIRVTNDRIKGSIEIYKVDSKTKDKLSDAKFCIYEIINNTEKELSCKRTDKNGIVKFDNLTAGSTYKIKETEAPYGYKLNSNEKTVKITNSDTVKFEFENERILNKIQIVKYDSDNKSIKLQHAKFELCKKEDTNCNNPIAKGETDMNGELVFSDIPKGEYFIIESAAPNGYTKSNDKITVKFNDDNQTVAKIDFYNKKTPTTPTNPDKPKPPTIYYERPNTGLKGTNELAMILSGVLGIIMIGGVVYYSIIKHKKNKEE